MGWLSCVLLAACILASTPAADSDQNMGSQALNMQPRAVADLEPEKIEYRPELNIVQRLRSEDQLVKRDLGHEMQQMKTGRRDHEDWCLLKVCDYPNVKEANRKKRKNQTQHM